MTDFYCKTTDERSMLDALAAVDMEQVTLDVIGPIEGADGWHFNIRTDLELQLSGVEIMQPETPYRVFA